MFAAMNVSRPWTVNDESGTIINAAGDPVRLVPAERRVVKYLQENPGRTITKTQLSIGADIGVATIKSTVSRIRSKCEGIPIHTIDNMAYIWGHIENL